MIGSQLSKVNPWAAMFTESNIEHMAQRVWESLEMEDRSVLDPASWLAGFRSCARAFGPVVDEVCAHNERLVQLATNASRLAPSATIIIGSES